MTVKTVSLYKKKIFVKSHKSKNLRRRKDAPFDI